MIPEKETALGTAIPLAANVLSFAGGTSRQYHNPGTAKEEIDRRLIRIRPLSFSPLSRRWALAEWSRLLTLRDVLEGGRHV